MNQYQAYSQNKNSDNKIILTDLIYYILLRWRTIFLVALIFCVLFFSSKLLKGYNSLGGQDHSEVQKTYERSYDEYMILKTQLDDKSNELLQSIQENEDYRHQSILMNLDPHMAYKSTLTYVVNDDADNQVISSDKEIAQVLNRKINSILGSYASTMQDDAFFQNIQQEIGAKIDKKYLAELVYVQVDYQSKLLHITAFGKDKNQVQSINDAIEKQIQNAKSKIEIAVGAHRLELISSYIGNDGDTDILIGAIPEDGENENISYQTSIKKLQKAASDTITDLQNQLMDCNKQLSELNEPAAPEGISRYTLVKASIKFGILGFIAGAFLMVYCYVLQYLGSGKLISSDEMQDRYGIPVMAAYKAPMCKQPNALDKFINRIYGISEHKSCLSDVYALAASNVMAHMEKAESVKILLAGNAGAEVFDCTVSEMREKLNDYDVEVIAAGNINENGDAIQKLQIAENIVLVEQSGVSRTKDIKKELQTLRDLNKEIVGAIVL